MKLKYGDFRDEKNIARKRLGFFPGMGARNILTTITSAQKNDGNMRAGPSDHAQNLFDGKHANK